MFVLGTINETLEPAPSVQGPLKVPIQTMDPPYSVFLILYKCHCIDAVVEATGVMEWRGVAWLLSAFLGSRPGNPN